MAQNLNEDTEFNDALRRHGILPPREATPSPPARISPSADDVLSSANPAELKDLEEEEFDSDTERIIASYRRQRLAELRSAKKDSKFGELYPISREDYTREVTDTSKVNIPGEAEIKGTGVVCFLYKEGQVASTQLESQLKKLAARHPRTKFVSIVGDKCIPNYADKLCPTLIVYRDGNVTHQVAAWGGDRERTLAELEAMLILSLAITTPPHPSNSKKDSDDDTLKDDEGRSLEALLSSIKHETSQSRPSGKLLRSGLHDDSDSDFDL